MSVETKSFPLSKVQTLAAEFVFTQLEQARQAFDVAEKVAKNRFGVVLAEIGVDQKYVDYCRFDNGPGGASISYDVDDGKRESGDAMASDGLKPAPVFDIPPKGEN